MAQLVQFQRFTLEDFKTQAGIDKFNQFMSDLANQIQAMQGSTGPIQPDNNIDLQHKFKVINSA